MDVALPFLVLSIIFLVLTFLAIRKNSTLNDSQSVKAIPKKSNDHPSSLQNSYRDLNTEVIEKGLDRANNPTKYPKINIAEQEEPYTKVRERDALALPTDFVLSKEFAEAFSTIETTKQNIFLTGRAGTGKSTFLTYLRDRSAKEIIVLAPTGVAALNIAGQTIHSFFKFGIGLLDKKDIKVDSRRKELYKKIDIVVIDEISMVRKDILDGIDYSLRIHRDMRDVPFGGVQVILMGDPYQLPPVVEDDELNDYFQNEFGGPFFFNADVIRQADLKVIEFKTVFRQKEKKFLSILNHIREGNSDWSVLEDLNKRVGLEPESVDYITLSGRNREVTQINSGRLSELPGNPKKYIAGITGKISKSEYPADSELQLKVGAQVMLLRNDTEKRWVNGTIGTVKKLKNYEIDVEIYGITYPINIATWTKREYYYDKISGNVGQKEVSRFVQFPIKLAWAITIHKSQGQTFDAVKIDLAEGSFAHGQTYVALSRCTKLSGVYLTRPVASQDIIVDPRIVAFMKAN